MRKDFFAIGRKHCAVITGASSGIGAEFARILSKRGTFVILSGRNEDALNMLSDEIGKDRCTVIPTDLTSTKNCIDLYAKTKKYDPDILINNAGFGVFGDFTETSLSKELEMIDVNIKAMHTLFKLYTKDFVKKDRGYILNVGSSAGLLPGPHMSAYYSSKSYVIRQTQAVYEELRRKKSHVHVSVLCPGPVQTEFNKRAGIENIISKGITPRKCAVYALKKMRENKLMILPTLPVKLLDIAVRLAPAEILAFGAGIFMMGKKKI